MSWTSRFLPAAAALLTLTACAIPVGATTVSEVTKARINATAWADSVCGTIARFRAGALQKPDLDGLDAASPQAAVVGLLAFTNRFAGVIDTAVSELDAARPAPTPEGDVMLTRFVEVLGTMRETVDTTKRNLKKANPNRTGSLEKAIAPLEKLDDVVGPLDHLDAGPEIDAAAAAAPNCRALQAAV
jgi:hypothetical protein